MAADLAALAPFIIVGAITFFIGSGVGYYTACVDEENRRKKAEGLTE